jgi:transcriptional regulator with XRE-family HTH domain
MLNERLKNLRLAKGLTLQQVGDAFGISRASVSSWKSGTNQPDPRKLEKLAQLFETSVEFLVTGQSHLATEISNIDRLTSVPYIPWELVSSPPKSSTHLNQVACLYSQPTSQSFATRYLGSSDLNWQQGAIPAGATVIVDRGISISHGCHVLASQKMQEVVIGQIFNGDVPGSHVIRFPNTKSSTKVNKSITIIGVILEWRIGAKL